MDYHSFISQKERSYIGCGFDCTVKGSKLFDFQKHLVEWALRIGRSAIFADCGLGKSPTQLHWADEVRRHTGKPVLILAPLAVSHQTEREAEKFGIDDVHVSAGNVYPITITNYEKLKHFNCDDFSGVVADESSILKAYSGKIRQEITEFMQPIDYRLLCTATPAPNDYMELGNSCEALSIMRRVEMLSVYFTHDSGSTQDWILRGHAESAFWRFMASWSRALRKPSDIGFDDDRFILPELHMDQHTLRSKPAEGSLFVTEAITLDAQRKERKATINERCETVASIANSEDAPFLAWCSLNDESKMLAKLIDGAEEVSGSDSDDEKTRKMLGFSRGEIKCLVTKPSIAGFGMNWQHCNRMSFFPSHSHEAFYQSVRRCWRFGQTKPVTVHIVTTEAESRVLDNMRRKERSAEEMYSKIVEHMRDEQKRTNEYKPTLRLEVPKWIA
jgi:hypothetical protein